MIWKSTDGMEQSEEIKQNEMRKDKKGWVEIQIRLYGVQTGQNEKWGRFIYNK